MTFTNLSSAGPHGTKSRGLLISCMSSLSPRWSRTNCYWKDPFTFISPLNEERVLVPVTGANVKHDDVICCTAQQLKCINVHNVTDGQKE